MEPKGGHNFKFDGQGPNDPDYPQEAEQTMDERGSSTVSPGLDIFILLSLY